MKPINADIGPNPKKSLAYKIGQFSGSLCVLSFAAAVSSIMIAVAVRLIMWIL